MMNASPPIPLSSKLQGMSVNTVVNGKIGKADLLQLAEGTAAATPDCQAFHFQFVVDVGWCRAW